MVRLVKEIHRLAGGQSDVAVAWKTIREDPAIAEQFKERLVSVVMACRHYKRLRFDSASLTNDPEYDAVMMSVLPEETWLNPLKSQQAQDRQQARAVSFEDAKKERVEAERAKMHRMRELQKQRGTRKLARPGEPDVIEEVEEVEEVEYVDDNDTTAPPADDGDWDAPPPPPADGEWDAPPPPPADDGEWDAPPPPPADDGEWDAPPPPPTYD